MEMNKIYNIDNVCGLKKLTDSCIDLTLTSPPYDDLRDYDGYSWDFDAVTKELYRVTKDGGIVVWVVGDSVIKGSKTLSSFRQALKFRECGFNVFDVIIYEKESPSPPHRNRYFNTFEYMFVFSKGKPKTVNLLKDRANKSCGKYSGPRTRRVKDGALTSKNKFKSEAFGIRTNIWTYGVGHNKTTKDEIAFQHPAIFPEKLAQDHILSWSNENDIVLDIFMGSGTTAKMCKKLKRNYIGFEISKAYCDIAEARLNKLYE